MSYEEKLEFIEQYGWLEYYRGYCVKKKWVDERLPYDRMACQVDTIYEQLKVQYSVPIIKDLGCDI